MANLTASTALDIQMRLMQMFSQDVQAMQDFNRPAHSAAAVFGNQSVSLIPIFNPEGKCVDYKIWWVGAKELTATSKTTPNNTSCDLPEGQTLDTLSKEFKIDKFISATVEVSDDLCANDVSFAELSSNALALAMQAIRKQLNTELIQFLVANAQPNAWTTQAVFDIQGTETYIAPQYWDASLLGKFSIAARKNKIPNYIMLNGINFGELAYNAAFTRLNDDQRSDFATLQASRMFWDMEDLDGVVGKDATFLINTSMVGFANKVHSTPSPIIIDPSKNISAFTLPDNVLSYRQNIYNEQTGQRSSAIVPIQYEVRHQRTCTGKNGQGKEIFKHVYDLELIGSIFGGPTGLGGETGILQMNNGTA